MRITPEQETQIKAIIATMDCPKGHACYESGFRIICDAGFLGDAVECLAEHVSPCRYGLSFGGAVFCLCPLRKYILETLGR
jgi:hypothetical protein